MKHKAIYVIKLGWVVIGTPDGEDSHGDQLVCDAATIRKWGTTHGLGQLALLGPTRGTVMDPVGRVSIPRDALLFVIACDPEKWGKIDVMLSGKEG